MNKENNTPGVLIIEDEVLYNESILRGIKPMNYEVIHNVKTFEDAKRIIEDKIPIECALVDLRIPDKNGRKDSDYGLEIVEKLRENRIPVLVCSAYKFPKYLRKLLELEVSYVIKEDLVTVESLSRMLDLVMEGYFIYTDGIRQELLVLTEEMSGNPLDDDQWKILALRAEGFSNKEIGEKLNYVDSHIRKKVSEIYKEIGISNQRESVRWFDQNAQRFGKDKLINDLLDSKKNKTS